MSVCIGPTGKSLFLDYNPLSKETKLCSADFHSPVRASVIKTALKDARSLTYLKKYGIAFVVERGTNRISAVEIDQKICLSVNKLKNKASLQEELVRNDLPVHGTINPISTGGGGVFHPPVCFLPVTF